LIEPRWDAKKHAVELAGIVSKRDPISRFRRPYRRLPLRRWSVRGRISHLSTSRWLLAICGLAVFWSASLSDAGGGRVQPAATLATLEAAYTATLLGFTIGNITWTIKLHDSRFSAVASGSTAGLLRIFAHGHGNAEADGTVAGQRPLASDFKVSFTSGNSTHDITIVFSGGTAREHSAPPPPPNPQAVPLSDAYRIDVVDPMTGLLIRVPGSGETMVPAACDRKIAVFDGQMRYDLRLAYRRIEQVRAETGYQGPVVVCGVSFTPLAGYDPNRYAIKYLQAERDMEIWLAPLIGTRLMAPFRVSVPTPIGLGVLQATRFVWTRQSGRANAMSAD
jgi:hypothetical protein